MDFYIYTKLWVAMSAQLSQPYPGAGRPVLRITNRHADHNADHPNVAAALSMRSESWRAHFALAPVGEMP